MYSKFSQSNQPHIGGGMVRGTAITNRTTMVRTADGEMIQSNAGKAPTVYKCYHGQGRGPIAAKPANYTFFDLMTDQCEAQLRHDSFEDWMFPDIRIDTSNPLVPQFAVMPQKMIYHGTSRVEDDNMSFAVVEQNTVRQYIYIPLNPSLSPVASFGDVGGSIVRRSDYLACIDVGDPRGGYLGNAFIQYVIPLNSPIASVVETVTTMANDDGSYTYLYRINDDPAVRSSLQEKWFNPMNHFFNGVIYPKVRPFMSF